MLNTTARVHNNDMHLTEGVGVLDSVVYLKFNNMQT